MKVRLGFVTNSSSTLFIIEKDSIEAVFSLINDLYKQGKNILDSTYNIIYKHLSDIIDNDLYREVDDYVTIDILERLRDEIEYTTKCDIMTIYNLSLDKDKLWVSECSSYYDMRKHSELEYCRDEMWPFVIINSMNPGEYRDYLRYNQNNIDGAVLITKDGWMPDYVIKQLEFMCIYSEHKI